MPYYNNAYPVYSSFLYGVNGTNITTSAIAEQHMYLANSYYTGTNKFPGYSAVRFSRFYSSNSASGSDVLYPNFNMSFNNFEGNQGSSNTWVYNQNYNITGGGGVYQGGLKSLGARNSGSISFGNFAHSYKGTFITQYRWVGYDPTTYSSGSFTLLDDPIVANTGNSFQLSNSLIFNFVYSSGSNSYTSFMYHHSNSAAIQLNNLFRTTIPLLNSSVTDPITTAGGWGGTANNINGGWRPNQAVWSGNGFVLSISPNPKTAVANSTNRGVLGYVKITPTYAYQSYGGYTTSYQQVLTANNCGFANTEFVRLVTQGAYYQNGTMESDGNGKVLDINQQIYALTGSVYGTVNVINYSSDGGDTWSIVSKTAGTNTTTANDMFSANGYLIFHDLCYAAGNVNQFVAISTNRNTFASGNTTLEQAVWRGTSSFAKVGSYTMDNGTPSTNAFHYVMCLNFGGTGNGYLLAMTRGNSTPSYAISKSTDGGSSWQTVNANPWSASANSSAVLWNTDIGISGINVLVYNYATNTWVLKIKGAHPSTSANSVIYYAYSRDDGVTWLWPDYFWNGPSSGSVVGKRMRKSWLGYNFGLSNISGLANNVQLVGITPGYGSFNSIQPSSGYA